MLYRENGQFKSTYVADQQMLPILQDRALMALLLAFAFGVVPFVISDYVFLSLLIPFLILTLAAIGLKRDENVYICNVLKCRPPGNRNPEPEEVAKCSPHLMKQIALIRPKLIIAMGRFAAQTLLNSDASIASLRGRLHQYAGLPLIVTYHPAYLLRNLPDKVKAWQDLVFARRTMQSL